MQLLLETHGVFEDLCNEGEATPCPAQTTRLLTVQFVAQFAIVLSPILGVIADRYGALQLMYVTAASGCLGLGLLTLATGFRVDNLVFVAFFLIGIMAMSSAVNTVQVGMLFGPITRQRVNSALNTLFDAGLLTYLALWGIYEEVGCSVQALLGGYLCVRVMCFGGSIYYWRVAVPVENLDGNDDSEEKEDAPAVDSIENISVKEERSIPFIALVEASQADGSKETLNSNVIIINGEAGRPCIPEEQQELGVSDSMANSVDDLR